MAADEGAWGRRAACQSADPEHLFVDGAAQAKYKAICTGCPVQIECLAYALDRRIEHGIWGGMTDRERRNLLRRRPTITSWRRLLEAARTAHDKKTPPGNRRRSAAG